jgi:hypothetical protein
MTPFYRVAGPARVRDHKLLLFQQPNRIVPPTLHDAHLVQHDAYPWDVEERSQCEAARDATRFSPDFGKKYEAVDPEQGMISHEKRSPRWQILQALERGIKIP